MRRLRQNQRELELRLGASISVHRLSSYGNPMIVKCPRDSNHPANRFSHARHARRNRTHQRGLLESWGDAIGRLVPLVPRSGLGNCKSDQAGAKQDDARNGQSEEAVRSKFFTHGASAVPSLSAIARTSAFPANGTASTRDTDLPRLPTWPNPVVSLHEKG
jgi:hypothetical protein